jgi:hypothetical protein
MSDDSSGEIVFAGDLQCHLQMAPEARHKAIRHIHIQFLPHLMQIPPRARPPPSTRPSTGSTQTHSTPSLSDADRTDWGATRRAHPQPGRALSRSTQLDAHEPLQVGAVTADDRATGRISPEHSSPPGSSETLPTPLPQSTQSAAMRNPSRLLRIPSLLSNCSSAAPSETAPVVGVSTRSTA